MKKSLLLSLISLIWCTSVFAQNLDITGKVTAKEDGMGMPGASISVKGSNKGTTTDQNGNFKISVPSNGTIIVSSIGYLKQEIKVGNKSAIDVALEVNEDQLAEVIVTSFGGTKRDNFTGSVATIKSKDIENRPVTSILQVLSGAAPGISSNSGTGQPGTSPAIRLRGFGSISAASDPLYVIDGVPTSADIANLPGFDIESITVLKDAASTALYGARAANGVIMVTTKRGQRDKSKISVRYSKGVNSRAILEYDRIDAPNYYTLMWEANRNSLAYRASNPLALATANTTATNGLKALVGYNVYNVPDNTLVVDGVFNKDAKPLFSSDAFDWTKGLIRQSSRDDVSVGMSGGQGKTDYYISLSYLNDKSFLVRSDYNRFTARANVNTDLKKFLKIGMNVNATISKSNLGDVGTNTAFVNPFFFSRAMAPIYPVYAYDPAKPGQFLKNEDGSFKFDTGNLSSLGLANRSQYAGRHNYQETQLNQNLFDRNVFSTRIFAEFSFLKKFKFTTNLGNEITNLSSKTFSNPIVGDGIGAGIASSEYSNVSLVNFNQLLKYEDKFGKSSIDLIIGHESYDLGGNTLTGTRSGQVVDKNIELINFTTTTNLASFFFDRTIEGYFSRLTYDYNQKYVFSLSARRDGSSKFNKDARWGTFYSVGTAWNIFKEDFISKHSAINNLKLRANYGITGNDGGISNYAWQPLYNLNSNNASEGGIIQGSLGNPNLQWELNTGYDIGLEFGIYKNRLSGGVEYFNRKSTDLLFAVPLPVSSGLGSQTRNVGVMTNSGIEIAVGGSVIRTKNFEWNIVGNTTLLTNTVNKMPVETPEIVIGPFKYKKGKSIYDYWLREFKGVDSETGEALYRATTFNPVNSKIVGKDTLTSAISNARFAYVGSPIPKFQGGISTSIGYKNFEVSAQVTYAIGGKSYDGAYQSLMGSGYHNAKHIDILKRWNKPGDITDIPRMDAGRTADFDAVSSRWLIDGTTLSLRNVNISYKLNDNLIKMAKIQSASVYVSGENLAIISNRKGLNAQQGFDGVTSNFFTPTKAIVMGISLNF